MVNEFEEAEAYSMSFEDEQEQKKEEAESMFDEGSKGQEYDISKAPKNSKGPERENLNNKEVIITDMKVILPPLDSPWKIARNNKTEYKSCIFILFYDNEGQREYYSGIKVFNRSKDGVTKYSEPNIQADATTQASQLLQTYAKFKGKTAEEVSLHEFFNFLKSKPKALIKQKEFKYDKKITKKNIVENFI